MSLLSRYILRSFIRNIGVILIAFISIYLLIDFFSKFDNFIEKDKPFSLIIIFFVYSIPYIINMMSPVCILLAGVVTLGLLNSSNELLALKAAGVPLKTIARPIIAASLICVLLALAMTQFVLPRTVAVTNEIWHKEVKGRVSMGIYRNGRYYYRGEDGFYSFARPDLYQNSFRSFTYATWNKDYDMEGLIVARSADWDNGVWSLHQAQIQTIRQETLQQEFFTNRSILLPEQPEDFFVPAYRNMELSLLDLYREAKRARSGEESNRAWMDFYGKISYAILGLPLLLLGLPMLLIVYRRWGRDLSLAIPVSCGMAFASWGLYTILQAMARAQYMHPLAAALLVHLTIGALGLVLLWREDT